MIHWTDEFFRKFAVTSEEKYLFPRSNITFQFTYALSEQASIKVEFHGSRQRNTNDPA